MTDSPKERILLALATASWVALGVAIATRPAGPRWAAVVALGAVVPGRALTRSLRRAPRDRLDLAVLPVDDILVGRGFEWTPALARALLDRAALGADGGLLHALGRPDERDLVVPPDLFGQHALVLGTTGVGKTRLLELLITQAIRQGDATAVIDPKGDDRLLARVIHECRRAGRGLTLIAPPYAGASAAYNPIASWSEVREVADRVAALLPTGGDAEPFRNFGWELAAATASALARFDRPLTLVNLRRYGIEDPWRLPRELFPGVKDPEKLAAKARGLGSPELDALVAVAARPREHALKMASGLLPVLAKLTAGSHRRLLSPEGPAWSWEQLDRDHGVAYFFLGSLLGADTANAVAKMALLDFQSHLGRRVAFETGARAPIWLFVDELADVITPSFINVINKGRGAGARVVLAAQTQSDLEAALGSRARAEQVVGNVNTVVQFRAQSQPDAEVFSALAGDRLLAATTEGEAYEPALFSSGFREVDDFRAVFSRQRAWRSDPFVPGWAIMQLPVFHYFARWDGRVRKGIVPLLPPAPLDEVEAMKDEARRDLRDGAGRRRGVGGDASRPAGPAGRPAA
jgi:conjugal transfer pilus assembly protein TraD